MKMRGGRKGKIVEKPSKNHNKSLTVLILTEQKKKAQL